MDKIKLSLTDNVTTYHKLHTQWTLQITETSSGCNIHGSLRDKAPMVGGSGQINNLSSCNQLHTMVCCLFQKDSSVLGKKMRENNVQCMDLLSTNFFYKLRQL